MQHTKWILLVILCGTKQVEKSSIRNLGETELTRNMQNTL